MDKPNITLPLWELQAITKALREAKGEALAARSRLFDEKRIASARLEALDDANALRREAEKATDHWKRQHDIKVKEKLAIRYAFKSYRDRHARELRLLNEIARLHLKTFRPTPTEE